MSDQTYIPAPDWVIEMMRTGKPVECWVSDVDQYKEELSRVICGFDFNGPDGDGGFISDNKQWRYATPVEELKWEPKLGDVHAFWDDGAKEVYVFGKLELIELSKYYPRFTRGYGHCALIESVEEIKEPVSYFIKRGKWV